MSVASVRFTCPRCGKRYSLDAVRLEGSGRSLPLRCTRCRVSLRVTAGADGPLVEALAEETVERAAGRR